MKVLIVDDKPTEAQKLREAFIAGEEILETRDLAAAADALSGADFWPDLIILDAYFPERAESSPDFMSDKLLDKMEEICDFKGADPPDVILVSGHTETAAKFDVVSTWLDAGRIRDVLPKNVADVDWSIFQAILRHKAEVLRRERELRRAAKTNEGGLAWLATCGIHTGDIRMATIWDRICQAAETGHNVLIQGETGTGKELVANAIAALCQGRIYSINCANTPEDLFERDLFGSAPRSFTGSGDKETPGLIDEAADQYLFMDEVCKLSPRHQNALLRVADEKIREFRRVAGKKILKATCRFIFADSFPIWAQVDKEEFSEELAYRLTHIVIELLPLRERRSTQQSDIRLLTSLFLDGHNQKTGKKIKLTEEVYRIFDNAPWPGNVRALEGIISNIATAPIDGTVTLEMVRRVVDPQTFVRQLGQQQNFADRLPQQTNSLPAAALADPLRLLAVLKMEITHPTPGTWAALGRKDGEEDVIHGHEHEALILKVLKLALNEHGQQMLDNLQITLKSRGNNDPRRVNIYKTLLYLALHPKNVAFLSDFGKITDLKSWLSRNKLAEFLVKDFGKDPLDPSQPAVQEEISGTRKVYRLCSSVLQK